MRSVAFGAYFVGWLMVRKTRASWRLLLASGTGVLLAITLVSTVILHSNVLGQSSLDYSLLNASVDTNLGVELFVEDRPLGLSGYEKMSEGLDQVISENLGWLFKGIDRLGNTYPMRFKVFEPDEPDVQASVARTPGYLFFQTGLIEHTRLESGRWPRIYAEREDYQDADLILEVMVGSDAASDLGWEVGTHLSLLPFNDLPDETITVVIVGLITAINPSDPYWFGNEPRLSLEDQGWSPPVLPIYVDEKDFFLTIGAKFPVLLGTYSWYVSLDVQSLTPSLLDTITAGIVSVENDARKAYPRSSVISSLPGAISEFRYKFGQTQAPILLFAALVVAVVFYYLVLVSWMLARENSLQSAMLQSRGASWSQVNIFLTLGESLLTIIPGVFLGPIFASVIVSQLQLGTNIFVGWGYLSATLLLGVLGTALVCAVVVLIVSIGSSGKNLIYSLRDRGNLPGKLKFFRYGVDFLFLGIVGILWFQLRTKGELSPVMYGDDADQGLDFFLFVTPAIVLLATGLLLLRVFPWILAVLGPIARQSGRIWLDHAVKIMSRDSLPYAALTVLVAFAATLGIFGAAFSSTLTTARMDQIRHAVGAELRLSTSGAGSYKEMEQWKRDLQELNELGAVSMVHRTSLGSPGGDGSGGTALLLVDSEQVAGAMWFREDFSDKDLESLFSELGDSIPYFPEVLIPEGALSLGIWVRPESSYTGLSLWVRLRDNGGHFMNLRLGDLEFDRWNYLEAPLPNSDYLEPPFSINAIYVRGSAQATSGAGSIALDELTVRLGEQNRVIEGFEDMSSWRLMPGLSAIPDTLTLSSTNVHFGSSSVVFTWSEANRGLPRGLYSSGVPLPIKAIGGPTFTKNQIVEGRVGTTPIEFIIVDIVREFPTVSIQQNAFLIADLGLYNEYQNNFPEPRLVGPTEVWIGLTGYGDLSDIGEELSTILPVTSAPVVRESEIRDLAEDPLATDAWESLTWVTLISLFGITVLGFSLQIVLIFRKRRLEFGVLRAIGFTKLQVVKTLASEILIIALVGTTIGLGIAFALSRWILEYLSGTIAGENFGPSLLITVDGRVEVITYLGIGIGLALSTILMVLLVQKIRAYEDLRLSE